MGFGYVWWNGVLMKKVVGEEGGGRGGEREPPSERGEREIVRVL